MDINNIPRYDLVLIVWARFALQEFLVQSLLPDYYEEHNYWHTDDTEEVIENRESFMNCLYWQIAECLQSERGDAPLIPDFHGISLVPDLFEKIKNVIHGAMARVQPADQKVHDEFVQVFVRMGSKFLDEFLRSAFDGTDHYVDMKNWAQMILTIAKEQSLSIEEFLDEGDFISEGRADELIRRWYKDTEHYRECARRIVKAWILFNEFHPLLEGPIHEALFLSLEDSPSKEISDESTFCQLEHNRDVTNALCEDSLDKEIARLWPNQS